MNYKKRTQEEWDKFYLGLAQYYSTMSKDPSTKVGAVVVNRWKNRPIGFGYNGFPKWINDTKEKYENRALKYEYIVHAEQNAFLDLTRDDTKGMTLYTWPFAPCSNCMKVIISMDIGRIVTIKEGWKSERWADDQQFALKMAKEADIEID